MRCSRVAIVATYIISGRGSNALIFKREALGGTSGTWSDDDYDIVCDGVYVGRMFRAIAGAPVGTFARSMPA